jgi:HTH-type transcriptional regulator, competence development regulator
VPIFGQNQSKMKIEKTFGETIRILREEKELPLREVAVALSIDTSMLGKIEKNSRKPTKQLIEKIAKFFNVSDKELMIAFLSDKVAYQVMNEEDFASEVLKVAEKKIKYLKIKKTS